MNRRQLLSATAAAAASHSRSTGSRYHARSEQGAHEARLQSGPTSEQRLRFFARFGVEGICGYPEDSEKKGYFSVDDLCRVKERCDKAKIELACIEPGFLFQPYR